MHQISKALLLNQAAYAQNHRLDRRGPSHWECLQVQAVANRVDLALAVLSCPNLLGAEAAVADNEPRLAHPFKELGRAEWIVLKHVLGVRRDDVGNAGEAENAQHDLLRFIAVAGLWAAHSLH